jgi:hypothetical protein
MNRVWIEIIGTARVASSPVMSCRPALSLNNLDVYGKKSLLHYARQQQSITEMSDRKLMASSLHTYRRHALVLLAVSGLLAAWQTAVADPVLTLDQALDLAVQYNRSLDNAGRLPRFRLDLCGWQRTEVLVLCHQPD